MTMRSGCAYKVMMEVNWQEMLVADRRKREEIESERVHREAEVVKVFNKKRRQQEKVKEQRRNQEKRGDEKTGGMVEWASFTATRLHAAGN